LLQQAAPFEPVYHLGERVETLTQTADFRWRIGTSAGTVVDCAAVIVASGGGAFGPNRPPLPGLEAYEATGTVRYQIARREELRNRRIVIAGGGDSAVDWALALQGVAAHVTLVHRRDKFRAAPSSVAKLHALADAGTIELAIPYQLAALDGEGGRMHAVVVRDLGGNTRRVEADILVPCYGLSMDLGPIGEWGLRLYNGLVAVEPGTCQTNLPGVFAIGDIAFYPGKLKLILSGFADAAVAAHAMFPIVRPGEALHFEYSTMKGVPDLAEPTREPALGED
jgi:thioredoxin reductase (NADPH)